MGGLTARVIDAILAYKGTLRRFSEESGIPYPSLMDYKSGKRNPGTDALIAIARTVDVSPAWLLTGEGDMYQHRAKVRADGKLLSRAATELALAWMRVKEHGKDADSAVREALPLDDQLYRRLVAKESGAIMGEIEDKIDHTVYMTVLAATIYNQVVDTKDEEERNREIRKQAYELITYTRAPRSPGGGLDVEAMTPPGDREATSGRRRKPSPKTRSREKPKK